MTPVHLSVAPKAEDLADAARVDPPAPTKVFKPYTFREILREPPKRWLVKNLIGYQEPVMLCADSKTGKTFVCFDLVAALIKGETFADRFDINAATNVIYSCAEGRSGLSSRFRALDHKWKLTPEEEDRFGIFKQVPDLWDADAPQSFRKFAAEVKDEFGADFLNGGLLIIDTWARATVGADENTAQDTAVILKNIDELIGMLDCTVMLVHHNNRAGNYRGSTNIQAGFDNMIEIKKSDSGRHTLSCKISKDAADIPDIGFELARFEFEYGGESQLTAYVDWTGEIDPAYKVKDAKEADKHTPRILEALERHAAGYDAAITVPTLFTALGETPSRQVVRKALQTLAAQDGPVKTRHERIKEKGTGKENRAADIYWFQQDEQ
jgi:RecA-family ATPase